MVVAYFGGGLFKWFSVRCTVCGLKYVIGVLPDGCSGFVW